MGATAGLTIINGKPLHYKHLGSGARNFVLVHGLGGSSEYFSAFLARTALQSAANVHLYDLEGHGLSPTHPLSILTVDSLAADLAGVFSHAGITASEPATIVAQSLGCLIALKFATENPGLVAKLVLLGPPPLPLPEAVRRDLQNRSEVVRASGMGAVVDELVAGSTSEHTKKANPLALSAIRLSLLGQEPESYAKACGAFAREEAAPKLESINVPVIVVTGNEDAISTLEVAQEYAGRCKEAEVVSLPNSGQWPFFEDVEGLVAAWRV